MCRKMPKNVQKCQKYDQKCAYVIYGWPLSKPQTHAEISAGLNFTWTAPGNDFNHGRALYYKIYCGYSRCLISGEFY